MWQEQDLFQTSQDVDDDVFLKFFFMTWYSREYDGFYVGVYFREKQ